MRCSSVNFLANSILIVTRLAFELTTPTLNHNTTAPLWLLVYISIAKLIVAGSDFVKSMDKLSKRA